MSNMMWRYWARVLRRRAPRRFSFAIYWQAPDRWHSCGLCSRTGQPCRQARVISSPGSVAQPRAEATDLGEVSAILHVAPLAAAVAAGVFKQPAAILAAALAQPRQIARGQIFRRRIHHAPQRPIQSVLRLGPLPSEFLIVRRQPKVTACDG